MRDDLYRELEYRLTDDDSVAEALERIGTVVLTAWRENIASSGNGMWPPLKPATIAEKRRRGYPPTPLIATGALLGSLSEEGANNVMEISGNTVSVGTSDFKAGWHVRGTERMPARDFTALRPEHMGLISDTAARWVRGEL